MNRADAAGGGGGALTTARRESQKSSRRRDVAQAPPLRPGRRDACNAGQFVDPSTGTKIFRRSADSSRAHCRRTPGNNVANARRRDCDIMQLCTSDTRRASLSRVAFRAPNVTASPSHRVCLSIPDLHGTNCLHGGNVWKCLYRC
jgi:hypothetical protein